MDIYPCTTCGHERVDHSPAGCRSRDREHRCRCTAFEDSLPSTLLEIEHACRMAYQEARAGRVPAGAVAAIVLSSVKLWLWLASHDWPAAKLSAGVFLAAAQRRGLQ